MARNNTGLVINGYSWADGKAEFNGIELPGVVNVDYKEDQTKVNNFGLGANAVSRSRGKIEPSGSMEMDYDTCEFLRNISPNRKLHGIAPGILVFSLEKPDGGKKIMTFSAFEFMSDGVAGSEGDDNLTLTTDIIFGTMTTTDI